MAARAVSAWRIARAARGAEAMDATLDGQADAASSGLAIFGQEVTGSNLAARVIDEVADDARPFGTGGGSARFSPGIYADHQCVRPLQDRQDTASNERHLSPG